ncbi:MAG TPA: FmdB family zinc ribbon protein [Candidatus Cybelea sp.]|jgi:putative FmdB family regulatory protein
MPLYDYACTKCGRTHEVRHGFDESYEQPCEACGGPLRRVFNPAPVLFKGSGFYVTDSRGSTGKAETRKEEAAASKAESSNSGAAKSTAKSAEPGKNAESAA